MSAQLQVSPILRPMGMNDLDAIMTIERVVYPFPWTLGNFKDSLNVGYECQVLEYENSVMGYGVLAVAAGEAHLLNLSIAREWQHKGMGRKLLHHFIQLARDCHASVLFLEVRPSNREAIGLYESEGFRSIAIRRGYYPTHGGREDAVLMELQL